MKQKIHALLLASVMLLALAACGGSGGPSPGGTPEATAPIAATERPKVSEDRQGNPITLPDTIEKVMTFGPSNAEVLVGLGLGGTIIAVDTHTYNIDGLSGDLPQFEMSAPDAEQIIAMKPDVIFVTGMVQSQGDDPYKPISDAGICVVYMPSSYSIEDIKEDIIYIAAVMGVLDRSDALISDMEARIDEIKAIGDTITEKKSVYFEIGAAPYMYSFGSGVFLNEMIEIIGAENVFADQQSWISVSDETILSLNPDVILTSVNYIDNPTGEIAARAGWNAMTAVQEGAVYYIDTDSSNRPSQNIVKALREMALAVYPEYYS